MIRTLVVDDQALVRAGFRALLDAEPDISVVAEAADGEEAVEAARRHRPDVVLMDVRMPRTDGLRATKADVVAHALAQLDPLPEHVLMVGDRSHDVDGAADHGIDTVVVEWGYGGADFDDPTVERPFRQVATVAALREVLGV